VINTILKLFLHFPFCYSQLVQLLWKDDNSILGEERRALFPAAIRPKRRIGKAYYTWYA